jgi:hypothetical protein
MGRGQSSLSTVPKRNQQDAFSDVLGTGRGSNREYAIETISIDADAWDSFVRSYGLQNVTIGEHYVGLAAHLPGNSAEQELSTIITGILKEATKAGALTSPRYPIEDFQLEWASPSSLYMKLRGNPQDSQKLADEPRLDYLSKDQCLGAQGITAIFLPRISEIMQELVDRDDMRSRTL